ncbi:hypothetical protein [Variovorax sp. Varisp62]|uniref:hypothetical protein n=1 Tax=Variovorax sp. Varisp62 TaxID=3243049 RepID=UPI0039B62017
MEYVSLREVLDSVSKQVPIPEDWEKILPLSRIPFLQEGGRYKNQTEDFQAALHKLKLSAINDLFQSAYQHSEAAPVLDQYLHNAAPHGPKWFDWRETGRPKISDSARHEGLRILVYMSEYFARCLEKFRAGRYDKYPRHGIPLYEGMFKNLEDSDRIKQIVFDRNELVGFLDEIGIPHSISAKSSSAQASAIEASLATSLIAGEIDSKERVTPSKRDSSEKSVLLAQPTSTIHRTPNPGDHKLRKCIDQARAEADNRDNVGDVWDKLKEMADEIKGPRPQGMGAFVEGKGIKYSDAQGFTRYFTKKLLGKQFSNERSKLRRSKNPSTSAKQAS